MLKLQADNISGVYAVDDFDGCEVLDQESFYESLASNPDGKIIGAEVDSSMASKIESEYGIQSLTRM